MPLKITLDEFKKHVPATASFDIAAMGADMLQVEDSFLIKAIGEEFYLDLCEKYEAGTATDKQLRLVEILISAVSNLAQANYLPVQPLQFSDRGVHIVSSADEKTPFEHQVKAAQLSFLYKGFQAIDRALRFLEKNIDAPDFALWAASDACTLYKQYLLSSAEEFSDYYEIGNSRRTFLALLPAIKKAERFYLVSILGEDLFAEIKEQLKDREVSVENTKLLELYLRPALAHLVVSLTLSEGGYIFRNGTLGLCIPGETPDQPTLNSKRAQAWADAQVYLTKLQNYLNRTPSQVDAQRTDPNNKTYGIF